MGARIALLNGLLGEGCGGDNALSLVDGVKGMGGGWGKGLCLAVGPLDTRVSRVEVSPRPKKTRGSLDEAELDPVVVIEGDVAKEGGGAFLVVDDDVDAPVVEEVAEGCASGGEEGGETAAARNLDRDEVGAVEVAEEEGFFGEAGAPGVLVDLGVDVAADEEKVFQAVAVEVEEACAPAKEGHGEAGNAGGGRSVGEAKVAVVAVENLGVVGECGVEDAEAAGVLEIADGDAYRMEKLYSPLSTKTRRTSGRATSHNAL